jgi:cysteinyl-tRNA synthetase
MNEGPEHVEELLAERERARRSKDFAAADALRGRIREAGFEVTDTPAGPVLSPLESRPEDQPLVHDRSEDVPSVLDRPPTVDGPTVQWVAQGWPEDIQRSYASVARSFQGEFQPVLVDAAGLGEVDWFAGEIVHINPRAGWAAAQNAGLRRAEGTAVILADGSIEFTADAIRRLVEAVEDPTVGLTGPFGIVTDDLREFRESDGPNVDAIEGYVMAFRRELLQRGLRFDERFKFYRTADIELSFQVKAMGLRATVTPVDVRRHEHRMWANTPDDERNRLSKKNFYRFLDRWRGRTDLLVSRPNG